MTTQYLLAGFGGQGILFSGKFLAGFGMVQKQEVSWLPSYGPEMRGGTANCSVILSDSAVGSPIVATPDILVAMNLPSLDKFEHAVKKGGTIFLDSFLITRKVVRNDVKVVYLPSTRLAADHGMPTLANIIMMGKVLESEPEDLIKAALQSCISAKRADMLEMNLKAFSIGKSYDEKGE